MFYLCVLAFGFNGGGLTMRENNNSVDLGELIAKVGGAGRVARKLGMREGSVYRWKTEGKLGPKTPYWTARQVAQLVGCNADDIVQKPTEMAIDV